ncbi:hypothetical protein QTP88_027333 [Uroleucon formosanum]
MQEIESNFNSVIRILGSNHRTSEHPNRQPRGLINAVGRLANILFGVCSDKDAEFFYKNIEDLARSEDKHVHLSQEQIRIVSSVMNNVNSTMHELLADDQKLQKNINKIEEQSRRSVATINVLEIQNTFLEHTAILTVFLNQFAWETQNLQSIVNSALNGLMHTNIYPPSKLIHELKQIQLTLPSTLELPITESHLSIPELFRTSKLSVVYIQQNLVFVTRIPLLSNLRFNLFHNIPLPIPTNKGNIVIIEPQAQYLAISDTNEYHFSLTDDQYEKCETLFSFRLCVNPEAISKFIHQENLPRLKVKNAVHFCASHLTYQRIEIRHWNMDNSQDIRDLLDRSLSPVLTPEDLISSIGSSSTQILDENQLHDVSFASVSTINSQSRSTDVQHAASTGFSKISIKRRLLKEMNVMHIIPCPDDPDSPEQSSTDFVACVSCMELYGKTTSTATLGRHKYRMTSSQNTIETYGVFKNKKRLPTHVKDETINKCVKYCSLDIRPMSAIKGLGFCEISQFFLDTGAKYGYTDLNDILPHPTTVSRHIISTATKIRKIFFKEVYSLIDGKYCASTCDMWTDNYKKNNYMTITIHFIDDQWLLHNRILYTGQYPSYETKTGENIKKCMINAFTQLTEIAEGNNSSELMDNLTFVTDQGTNIINNLDEDVEVNIDSIMKILGNKALTILDNKFQLSDVHEIAVFLWPKFKMLKMFSEENGERSRILGDIELRLLKFEIEDGEKRANSVTETNINSNSQELTSKEATMFSEWEDGVDERAQQSIYKYKKELESYREENYDISDDQILDFWSKQTLRFPYLSKLARQILAIPASSASSERTFSVDGLIMQLKERFTSLNKVFKIFEVIQPNPLINLRNEQTYNSTNKLVEYYDSDLSNALAGQILLFRSCFKEEITKRISIKVIENPSLAKFSEICKACMLFFTLPVTVATAERSFSKLILIKNYLQSTMCEESILLEFYLLKTTELVS